jgi:hypothetical protein
MSVFQIPVPKVKGKYIEIDTESLPEEVYKYVVHMGFKAILGRGATGIKRENFAKTSDYEAAIMETAEKQAEMARQGKTRLVGMGKSASAKKADPIHTEAVRIAKKHARDVVHAQNATVENRADRIKMSTITAAEWTRTAEAYISSDPDFWYKAARDSLSRAAVAPVKGVDFMPKVDSKLVEKAQAAAAAKTKAAKSKQEGKEAAKSPAIKGKAKAKPQANA